MSARRLQAALASGDKNHRPLPPSTREEIEVLLKQDWSLEPGAYLYLHDSHENVFVAVPDGEAFEVHVSVKDKFGLFGLLGREKVVELHFGLLALPDVISLLKLFFDDNYPALRSLHLGLQA